MPEAMGGASKRPLVLAFALAGACGGSAALARVPEGAWGGPHLGLVVGSASAAVELDCAHGEITVPLRLEADGSFRLPGYLVHDFGPTPLEEVRLPATYSGSSDGRRITLSVTLPDTGESRGPFTALPGEPPQVYGCE
jgi:hypothetical protein